MKHFIHCLGALLLFAGPVSGDAKEQLQKALFAEEVEQDGAKAAAIYQRVIDQAADAPRDSAIARFRLAGLHRAAGREAESMVLLKALAADPAAPAEWVVEAKKAIAAEQNDRQHQFEGPSAEVYDLLKDKLWYWHSGDGEPFGALRFLPEGGLETTLGVDWLSGWMPITPNRIRIYKPGGKYWIIELSEDGRTSKGVSDPGAVDPFKFIRSHPVSSTTIEDAEIGFLRKILTNQPDAVAALKIPCRLAKRNRTQSLAFLLDHGIEIDLRERDSLNYTPLMYAAEYGDVAMVRFLLDRGANVNALDSRKVTPLFIAAWHGRPSVVSMLLDRGADAAISSPEVNDGDKRMDYGTALHGAVQQGYIEVVKLLVGRGADINAVSPVKQHTPLICALALQRSEVAEELLKHGADPNLPVSGLANPLRQMAFQGNLPLLRMLLEKGAKLDMQSNESRLFRGVPRTVGAALVAAAREGNLHVAKVLVDAGCPVDQIAPIYRETSLHAAALHGNTLMCRWLLESGADIRWPLADHVGVQSGWVPLHSAAWSGSIEVADLLMQKGASPMDPCSDAGLKRSSFHLASLGGSHALVKLMLDHAAAKQRELAGKMLTQTDVNGDTALHLAVSREARPNAELVRTLIAAGANPEVTNRLGRTPRQLAVDPELGTQDPAVRSLIGR